MPFFKPIVVGRENLPDKNRPVVYIANHQVGERPAAHSAYHSSGRPLLLELDGHLHLVLA